MELMRGGRHLYAVGVTFKDEPQGALCWEENGKEWVLQSIYIHPEYRHLGPVIEALRHRLQGYCEQNRVSLNGDILDETTESAHLSDNDITDWFENVREYNQWKHHFNVSGGPLSDEERERFREMRKEAGRQENLQNRQNAQPWQRTRDEAVSTPSDLLEQNSRQELRRMNRRLHEAGLTDVAKIVHESRL